MSIDDDASEHEAIFLKAALDYRMPTLPHVGICYNCDAMIAFGNFCDNEGACQLDYTKRQNFNKGMR